MSEQHGSPDVAGICGRRDRSRDGLLVAAAGSFALVDAAAIDRKASRLTAIIVYTGGISGLNAMFGCSAAYSPLQSSHRRDFLRRLDQSAIFLMIARAYTPCTTLCLKRVWAIGLTALVWSGAAMGIALEMLAARALDQLSVGIDLALGWAGLIATGPLSSALAPSTLALLGVGGLVYSFGVIFHIWESLPFQKAVRHGLVLVAARLHDATVCDGVVVAHAS
jgi:hemolysin III